MKHVRIDTLKTWTKCFLKFLKAYLGLFKMSLKKEKINKKIKKYLLKSGPGDSQKKN
jgi:hypothetical protein